MIPCYASKSHHHRTDLIASRGENATELPPLLPSYLDLFLSQHFRRVEFQFGLHFVAISQQFAHFFPAFIERWHIRGEAERKALPKCPSAFEPKRAANWTLDSAGVRLRSLRASEANKNLLRRQRGASERAKAALIRQRLRFCNAISHAPALVSPLSRYLIPSSANLS